MPPNTIALLHKSVYGAGALLLGYLLLLSASFPEGRSFRGPAYQSLCNLACIVFVWQLIAVLGKLLDKHGRTKCTLGVLLVAAAMRFGWAVLSLNQPVSDFLAFHENALALASGTEVVTKCPGYVFLLSLAYRISPHVLTGKILNACLGTMTVSCVNAIGTKVAGERAGVTAAALMAILPSEILMTSTLGSDTLATFMTALVTWILVNATSRESLSRPEICLLAGVACGFSVAARSSLLFYIPAAFIVLAISGKTDIKAITRRSLFCGLGFPVGLGIVAVGFFLSTNGHELNPFTGQDSLPFLTGTNTECYGNWNEADAKLYGSWPPDQRNALALKEAYRRIVLSPSRFLANIPPKMFILFGGSAYGTQWALADYTITTQLALSALAQGYWVAILLASLLAYILSRDWRLPLAVVALILLTALPHTVIEVQGRYHHYIVPLIMVLAGSVVQHLGPIAPHAAWSSAYDEQSLPKV